MNSDPSFYGLDGLAPGSRVVVAMSGGVDSSATAALLQDLGFDVVGVTMQLYDQGKVVGNTRTCCAGRDIHDARRVAEILGVPHYVVDYEQNFRAEVMEPFADSYIRGETPIPCVSCNQTVKARDLVKVARDLGAVALATGHYVRRRETSDGPIMLRGADERRDQSYFLFATTREQLGFLRFPLGGMMSKDETRAIAARHGLPVAGKPDSQDICFVPGGDYASVVEKLRPGAQEPGEIVHLDGQVLGTHEGIIHYTIGQRRGLALGGGAPLFVLKLDPAKKQVVVGPREALAQTEIRVRDLNWLGPVTSSGQGVSCQVRVRSTRQPKPGILSFGDKDGARVVLDAPEEGVAPGQACVFYDADRVLGGGWIIGARIASPKAQGLTEARDASKSPPHTSVAE
jgi:tRNA-specific 2-thiouridylase